MDYILPLQIIGLLGIFYFFMIRPQQTKIKAEKQFEASLKTGSKIITKSGFHGKIVEVADKTVIIETMSGKLKIEKSAISPELSNATEKK